ncbi:MAG TPA: hypothetical protein VFR59_08885 [Steroidobacteraceae bacterium]|nr:hypothetical protein [Steroidobacteraceae bacterium]
MRCIARVFISASLVFIVAPADLLAYEDDTHFGLSHWLTLQAGFDQAQAAVVANHAVWVDHTWMSATRLVAWYACLRRDAIGSRQVQKIHFPGDAELPAPPADRAVSPGSYEALRGIRDEITHPARDPEVSLGNFGEGLHPYEDSWSHQGIPDPPLKPLCNEELSWGHPAARGGWRRHDADHTYRYPKDALAMANATFDRLCEYAQRTAGRKCTRTFSGDLLTHVQAFIGARTKEQKRTWFVSQGFKDTRFLKHISLPRGKPYDDVAAVTIGRPSNREALGKSAEEGFMLAFFEQWQARSERPALVGSMIDVKRFRYPFGPPRPGVAPRPVSPELAMLLLELWRVREHGDVADALHGSEPPSPETLVTLLNATKDANVAYKGIEDALLPIDESGAPFMLATFEMDGEKYLVALARLRHAPYETVAVFAQGSGADLRVVGIDSMVDD